MNKQEWIVALKSFQQTQRQLNPIPDRDSLSDEEEWHCRIIGGEFTSWFKHQLRKIVGQRTALRVMSFDPQPLIVFTTTIPGLVAAREIIPGPSENFFYLLHTEFQEWGKDHPVDKFTFHIHHWSYFRQIDQELLLRAHTAYPEVNAEEYRIHSSGDLWGVRCGAEGDHLWRWNGQEMELLEEAFSQKMF
jgi:hypothetical protein